MMPHGGRKPVQKVLFDKFHGPRAAGFGPAILDGKSVGAMDRAK